MPYNELIKNFNNIRNYMRDFFVYGFRTRSSFDVRSLRSYDNERRRVESWLGDYMSFRQDTQGKSVFISVDGRDVPRNPLYNAFKTKSFTDKDILFHFSVLNLLRDNAMSIPEIAEEMDVVYNQASDESTIRKKLKEYCELGIVTAEKIGRKQFYKLAENNVNLDAWRNAVEFYSEANPVGVIGSFIQDRAEYDCANFSFKHHYLLGVLESEIISDILTCRREHRMMQVEIKTHNRPEPHTKLVYPLRILTSTQTGRQYLVAYNYAAKRPRLTRMDFINRITPCEIDENHDLYEQYFESFAKHLWGSSSGNLKRNNRALEHIEFTISYADGERHIPTRLEREKRIGTVEHLDTNTCKFSADVYEVQEMIPWIRTFIGRIIDFKCSNAVIEKQFFNDIEAMKAMYDGGDDSDI